MIKETINGHIMSAMKAGDKIRTKALRAIKDGIMNWETAKNNVGKTLDDATEITIIRKLKDQYLDAAAQCNDGNHNELVAENNAIAEVLSEFLPAPVTEDAIQSFIAGNFTNDELIKKNMGIIIKAIKAFYPAADGKLFSQVVLKNLH